MKNGKYALNYQHVCFEAPGCATPYVPSTFIPVWIHSVFLSGQKAELYAYFGLWNYTDFTDATRIGET